MNVGDFAISSLFQSLSNKTHQHQLIYMCEMVTQSFLSILGPCVVFPHSPAMLIDPIYTFPSNQEAIMHKNPPPSHPINLPHLDVPLTAFLTPTNLPLLHIPQQAP